MGAYQTQRVARVHHQNPLLSRSRRALRRGFLPPLHFNLTCNSPMFHSQILRLFPSHIGQENEEYFGVAPGVRFRSLAVTRRLRFRVLGGTRPLGASGRCVLSGILPCCLASVLNFPIMSIDVCHFVSPPCVQPLRTTETRVIPSSR